MGDLRHLAAQVVGDDLARRYPAAVEALDSMLLGGRQSQDVAVQLWNDRPLRG
jgi:hypothetical protein